MLTPSGRFVEKQTVPPLNSAVALSVLKLGWVNLLFLLPGVVTVTHIFAQVLTLVSLSEFYSG